MLRIPSHVFAIFYEILFQVKIFYIPLLCCNVLYVSIASLVSIDNMLYLVYLYNCACLLQFLNNLFSSLITFHALEYAGLLIISAVSSHDVNWLYLMMPHHPFYALNSPISAIIYNS